MFGRLLRRRSGGDATAFDSRRLAAVCGAAAFSNRNFTLLADAVAPGAFPMAISIPLDSSSTVIPLPWPTNCTACPGDAIAGSKVMGTEKIAGAKRSARGGRGAAKGCGVGDGSAAPLVRTFGVVTLGGRRFCSAARVGNEGTFGCEATNFGRPGFPTEAVLVRAKSRGRNATRPMARKLTTIAK